ncbi:respiratory nitrate reductase subunit gamma [Bacteroidota bacterium]
MSFFVGAVLPYITIIIFLGGLTYHFLSWRKLPKPKMTLTPAPKPGIPRFIALLKETFFFKSLFKGDKNLWIFSWIFHVMLVLVFVGHFRVLSWLPDRMLASMGMTEENINTMSQISGGTAGIIILLMLLVLLIRRLLTRRVREISMKGDFIALILVLIVLITGDAMRFISHFDLSQTREYFLGLVTFTSVNMPDNNWFIAHYLFAQVLLMYMPFSKLLHFGGIFFTEALIQEH